MRSVFAVLIVAVLGGTIVFGPVAFKDTLREKASDGATFVAEFDRAFSNFVRQLDGPPGELNPDRPT